MSYFSFSRSGFTYGLAFLPLVALGVNLHHRQIAALQAESLLVTTLADTIADDGFVSLREAIASANSGQAGASPLITFATDLSGTLSLTGGEFVLSHNVSIQGNTNGLVLDANNKSRLFNIGGVNVALSALTLTGGKTVGGTGANGAASSTGGTGGDGMGGAIYSVGNLSLTDVILRQNLVQGGTGGNGGAGYFNGYKGIAAGKGGIGGRGMGGAIFNAGTLTLTTTTLSDNTAQGGTGGTGGTGGSGLGGSMAAGMGGQGGNGYAGAIYNAGLLQVISSTSNGNRAVAGSGGAGGAFNVPNKPPTYASPGSSGSAENDDVRDVLPVATNSTVSGDQNYALSGQLQGSADFSLTYILVSGSLPPGLSLNPSTGVISGTPTVEVDEHKAQFKVNDGFRDSNVATITFKIAATEPASLMVTTAADITSRYDNLTSLREAIAYANSDGAGENPVITFANTVRGTLAINNGEFALKRGVTVDGGTNGIVLDAQGKSRLFSIEANSDVMLRNLTLTRAMSSGYSSQGGAICMGGGFYRTFTVQNCTFVGNSSSYMGGAIYNYSATLLAENCTFTGNTSNAIANGNTAILRNCTLTGNRALSTTSGAALYNLTSVVSNSTAKLYNCIMAGNNNQDFATSTGGRSTLIARNDNLIGGTAAEAGLEVDAQGNPVLKDNGGPTPTVALLEASDAIDRGNNETASSGGFDQRGAGYPRIRGKHVDAGAFEFQQDETPTPTPTPGGPTPTPVPTATPAPTPTPTQEPTPTPVPTGMRLSGRVVSSEPNASYTTSLLVPCANAVLVLDGPNLSQMTTTDSAGNYTFSGLTLPGTYNVRVRSIEMNGNSSVTLLPFYLVQTLKITKKTSPTAKLTLSPFTLYSIWGQVRAKSNAKSSPLTPISGANVQLSKSESSGYPAFTDSAVTNTNGIYVFKYLGRAAFKVNTNVSGLTFKNATAKLPGTKKPAAPSLRLDLTGTHPETKAKDSPSFHSS